MTYNTACNDINQYFKLLTGNTSRWYCKALWKYLYFYLNLHFKETTVRNPYIGVRKDKRNQINGIKCQINGIKCNSSKIKLNVCKSKKNPHFTSTCSEIWNTSFKYTLEWEIKYQWVWGSQEFCRVITLAKSCCDSNIIPSFRCILEARQHNFHSERILTGKHKKN